MLREAIVGFGIFLLYYLVGAFLLVFIRLRLKPPREVFRKMLHMLCVCSIFVLTYAFKTWFLSAGAALLFAVIVYPAVWFIERFPKMMDLLVQRRGGELKSSLMIVFFMMATLITVFWGLLGAAWKGVILAVVLAWGVGDAVAALIGKRFGKRRFNFRFADPKKTAEGTAAMCAAAFFAVLITLLVSTALPWYVCATVALVAAPVAAFMELVSGNGVDTITVPFAAAAALFLTILPFVGFGGAL